MSTLAMQLDLLGGHILKGLSKVTSLVGFGIVQTDSREYVELLECYRTSNYANRMGDFPAAALQLSKQFTLHRMDGIRVGRAAYVEALKHRFEAQIGSDFREDPVHFVIGARHARIASRVYSKTLMKKGGKVCELEERSELISTWIKTSGGWMRHRVRIRSYEQNQEWVELVNPDAVITVSRTKYSA